MGIRDIPVNGFYRKIYVKIVDFKAGMAPGIFLRVESGLLTGCKLPF
jgi:hypothetical protein